MTNQTLQPEERKQATARLIFRDGFTPYKCAADLSKPLTAQCLRVDGVTILGSANRDVHANIEYVEHKPAIKLKKKKITGFAEKIDPFAGKHYVAPKAVQDKIEDVKQLLKGSPIPEEFLK
ncbi:hypothetical protein DYBT9275_04646 [Dyadobacter sp. CECT 9275]|uniref:Uncharacterized protein n=1 Tax=Dyadobacter helix TaxID=2822344 RepID=A0A916JH32_9BACT|nr:hypothetical protein [Dyadobacter sp. CECT 9275]CAG5010109.1 hypothetical protein DYBT9275_04646 [Dyadobacter sp. CECT 9275]